MNNELLIRRNFFDSYSERHKLPSKNIRFSCPCCGYPTLDERGAFNICQLCWWEDDGQDDSDADVVRGGPNHHYSLTEARINFEKYLIMYLPEKDPRIGGADSEKVGSLKRNLIAAYNKMLEEPPSKELNNLWKEVEKIEKTLRRDLKDSIKEYEAKIIAEDS